MAEEFSYRYFALPIGEVDFLDDSPELSAIIDSDLMGVNLAKIVRAIPLGFHLHGHLDSTDLMRVKHQIASGTGFKFSQSPQDQGFIGEYHKETQRYLPPDLSAVLVEGKKPEFFHFNNAGRDSSNSKNDRSDFEIVQEIVAGLLEVGYRGHLFFSGISKVDFHMYRMETDRKFKVGENRRPGGTTIYYAPPCIAIGYYPQDDNSVDIALRLIKLCKTFCHEILFEKDL